MSLSSTTGALTLPNDLVEYAAADPANKATADIFQDQNDAMRVGINNLWVRGATGGTANAIELAVSADVDALIAGAAYYWKAGATTTDAATLNVNGLGAKALVDETFAALPAGDIVSGHWYLSTYDSGSSGRFVTRVAAPAASATRAGLVELATTDEATTGTDTTRAVTPAGVKAVGDTKFPKAGGALTGAALSKVSSVSYASTVTLDLASANDFVIGALGGALTLANPSNATAGCGGCIQVTQGAGGGVTPTLAGNWKVVGTANWNTAANGVSLVGYKVLADNVITCAVGSRAS